MSTRLPRPAAEASYAPAPARAPQPALMRLARVALAPLLYWQGAVLKRKTPRLPEAEGLPFGKAGYGVTRLRLLIVGDSSAAGVGVAEQSQALAAQLAQALVPVLASSPLGAGAVSWQVVARTGLTAEGALAMMAATKLQPADLLITVLGVNDVLNQTPPDQWLRALDAIRGHARHRAKVLHTVHCSPPRMDLLQWLPQPLRWLLGSHAARLDTALRRHVRQAHRRSRFALPFDPTRESAEDWLASDGFHPNAALYRRWAQALADHIDLDLAQGALTRAVLPSHYAGVPDSSFSGWGTLR